MIKNVKRKTYSGSREGTGNGEIRTKEEMKDKEGGGQYRHVRRNEERKEI